MPRCMYGHNFAYLALSFLLPLYVFIHSGTPAPTPVADADQVLNKCLLKELPQHLQSNINPLRQSRLML